MSHQEKKKTKTRKYIYVGGNFFSFSKDSINTIIFALNVEIE